MSVLVFDADGVVCVGGPFTVHLEREYGIPPTAFADFFHGVFRDCVLGRRDLAEELSLLLPSIGWRSDIAAFLDFWFSRENVVDAQLLATVAGLRARGIRCVLGTNQERLRLAFMRSVMGFARAFDHVFASCELGAAKPDAAFFGAISRALGCDPAEITLIDDAERNVLGARACGWNAVHYRSNADLIELEAVIGSARTAAALGPPET